jgi:hypothetical protein
VRDDGDQEQALTNTVTPGYFQTMRIPLREGQDFADLGDPAAPPQAVVNEEFVREFTTDVPVLGRRIDSAGRTYSIVGVVANSAYQAFDEPPTPFIYLSYRDRPSPQGEIHLRPRAGGATEALKDLRRIVRGINVTLPLYNVRTLGDHVEQNLVFQRIPARIFAVIGPLLVVLAAIGISAVVAHSVADRRQEIGVRLALGATPRRVAGGIVVEMMWVIGAGAAVGWAIAFLIDRSLIESTSFDLTRFVAVPALLLGVGVVACWVPAIRATRRGPMHALRSS